MELVLVTLISVLCTILLFKLLYKLRSTLLWRVNCWFCNNNSWVKFPIRNSWTCQSCEQYNGFTKDGDYNKPIIATNDPVKTPKVFHKSSPRNGLCKMCNINQQLKVTQLANFVPMNDKSFDQEIESYRMQLEKAYKLCNLCKKVLQMKLHREKESLLDTKLLESRSSEKKSLRVDKTAKKLKSVINNASMFIAVILLMIVLYELNENLKKSKNSTISNLVEILMGLLERIYAIVKMKTYMTFPSLEVYLNDIPSMMYYDYMPFDFLVKHEMFDNSNIMTQKFLGGFVCLIQIIGHIWNINSLQYTIIIDLLWSIFVISSLANSVALYPVYMSIFKVSSILGVIFVYKRMNAKNVKTAKVPLTQKKIKSFNNSSKSSIIDDDDVMTVDSDDDDVSLSKFGVHNFSESSHESASPVNNSKINGRSFTPRCDSTWSKPKLNSTFCMMSKSPSSVSDTVFVKPSFNKYQKLTKDDSDSDLDESINSLCISSPKKTSKKNNSIFSLRKFTATPSFIAPSPMTRGRPLISPSKLGHGTSWVAGGYWGAEGDRQLFNVDGSRSSSQSSGFESQTSSINQRNVFSHPPSREDSVCGEPMLLDRYPSNVSQVNYQTLPNGRVTSPVFPQMQYNSHVQIPQPRFAQQNSVPNNLFMKPHYVQSNMFKTPVGSGLIKLPHGTSFTTQ